MPLAAAPKFRRPDSGLRMLSGVRNGFGPSLQVAHEGAKVLNTGQNPSFQNGYFIGGLPAAQSLASKAAFFLVCSAGCT